MEGYNKTIVIGRVADKPILTRINSVLYADFKLVNTSKDENGNMIPGYHDIKCRGKQAEIVGKNVDKGMLMCVEGSLILKDGDYRDLSSIKAERITFLSIVTKKDNINESVE